MCPCLCLRECFVFFRMSIFFLACMYIHTYTALTSTPTRTTHTITKNTVWGEWKRDEYWVNLSTLWKCGWICSISVEGGWKCSGGGWICPHAFSVSPTCRFHLLVDFTYLGMLLGMLLSRGPKQFLGSHVVNSVLTIRLVQRLKVILHQINKKRQTSDYLQNSCTCTCLVLSSALSVFVYTSFSPTVSFYHRNQFSPSDSSMEGNDRKLARLVGLHPKKGENKNTGVYLLAAE